MAMTISGSLGRHMSLKSWRRPLRIILADAMKVLAFRNVPADRVGIMPLLGERFDGEAAPGPGISC